MPRRFTALLALFVLITLILTSTAAKPAIAKRCPDGKVERISSTTAIVTCVSVIPPTGRKKITDEAGGHYEGEWSGSEEGDTTGSVGPDPETARKWEVQASVEFMCRELGICHGKDAWETSQCSMDPDAPYGTGRGLPGERCPTYVQPDADEDSGDDSDGDDPPPTITPERAAKEVIARLELTAASPRVGPNRDHHDLPFDTAVGFPVWLWTAGGTTSGSVTENVGPLAVGISIRLDKVVWDLGDGKTLRCDMGTEWRRGTTAGKKSPTCGHVYEAAGKYTIEATTHWTISWSAGGQSGTVPYSITADRPFEVGEIHVLVR